MKTYTITIETQAESEYEAFVNVTAAVNRSSDFSILRHRLDSCTVEEYDESEYFDDEVVGQQQIAFNEQIKDYLENEE